MLILRRKPDEAIDIVTHGPQAVRVRVLEIVGGEVKLGFEADRSVKILREEVTDLRPYEPRRRGA